MGHLNGILARVGGNLNNNFQKSQMPGGGGGMLKLRFDQYINWCMSPRREVLIRILARLQRKTLIETKNRILKCLKWHYLTVQSMKNVAMLT